MIAVGWGKETAAFRRVFTDLLLPDASPEQVRWLAEMQRATVSPGMAVQLWRAFHKIDIRKSARRITVPVVVFHVRGDQMVPFEAGRELAALIPEAQFVPLKGENHILLEDDPSWERFLSELHSFLGTRGPRWTKEEIQQSLARLTPRELEVLQLVGEGLSNDKIADTLVIAPKTARNHVSRIYTKLALESRAQAVLFAQQANLSRSDNHFS
jgi:DNA-binding CsgD family transcriptional regulator